MKANHSKRLLSWLLVAVMILTMAPISAFAAEPENVTIHQVTAEEAGEGGTYETFNEGDIIAAVENGENTKLVTVDGESMSNTNPWIYEASNEANVTVQCIENNFFALGGSIGTLTIGSSEDTGAITNVKLLDGISVNEVALDNTNDGTYLYLAAGATVTVASVSYMNERSTDFAIGGNRLKVAFTPVDDSVPTVTITDGIDIAIDVTGKVNAAIAGDDANVTITGDLETLTATDGGTVTVNGDVGKYKQGAAGSPTITISGDLGAVDTIMNAQYGPTLNVGGTLTGTVQTGGVYDSAVTLNIANGTQGETADDVNLKLSAASGKHPEVSYNQANHTLTVSCTATSEGGSVQHMGTGSVDYNIVLNKKGVFNTNGKNITGTVTFDNALAGEYPKTGALTTSIPTVTDGIASDVTPSDNAIPFAQKVTFTEGAAGYVDGLLHSSNLIDLDIGENAYAAFSYARLSAGSEENRDMVERIGAGATVNLNASRTYGGSYAGKLNNSGLAKAEGAVTILMGENAEVADATLEIAPNAVVTLFYYADGDTMAQSITVGTGARLTVKGAGKPTYSDGVPSNAGNALQISGAGVTTVGADATLTLEKVWHARNEGSRDILAEHTSTTKLIDAVYHGATPNGTFETGSGSTDDGPEQDGNTPEDPDAIKKGEPQILVYRDAYNPDKPLEGLQTGGYDKFIVLPVTGAEGNKTLDLSKAYAKAGYKLTKVLLNGEEVAMNAKLTGLSDLDQIISVFAEDFEVSPDTSDKTTDVVFNDSGDTMVVHNNHYIVHTNDTLVVTLQGMAAIGSGSTFDLQPNSTIKFVGEGENSKILANMAITRNDVTVILDNVTWDRSASGINDYAPLRVAQDVTGVKLLTAGDSTLIGADGADGTATLDYISASNSAHSQSAGVHNAGELTIEVAKGKTLTIEGGAAAVPGNNSTTFYGGAGVYNTNTGKLTFAGAGVIEITGGAGGAGYSWTTAAANDRNGAAGGNGGQGGFGVYNNNGSVTVAMTSAKRAEGQLAVTGGDGGAGGKGQEAGQVQTCTGVTDGRFTISTVGGKAGNGGDTGSAVYTGDSFIVNSGVFLAYSGQTAGAAGIVGPGSSKKCADNCKVSGLSEDCGVEHYTGGNHYTLPAHTYTDGSGNQTSHYHYNIHTHSSSGTAGVAGSDAATAIVGANMAFTGGTTYAQGGANYGVDLTGTATISGGSIYAGLKSGTGFDDAVNVAASNTAGVAGVFGTHYFHAANSYTDVTKVDGGKYDANHKTAYTRVKFAGLEGGFYRVVGDIQMTAQNNDASVKVPYTYGADSLYVNPQGFAYLYLPRNSDTVNGTYKTTIDRVVVEDENGVRYLLHSEEAVELCSSTHTQANNYIQLAGTWGETFESEGRTYATGVDAAWLDKIIDTPKAHFGWQDDGLGGVFYNGGSNIGGPDGVTLRKPEHLASLAWAIAHDYRDCGADFADGYYYMAANIDLSAFLWGAPIGTQKIPFTGAFESFGGPYTVSGLRMPADYTGDAYGLFGYLGAAGSAAHQMYYNNVPAALRSSVAYLENTVVNKIIVNGTAVTDRQFAETLKPQYIDTGMTTNSGGHYGWTAADMEWIGTVNYMGAIAGRVVNASVTGCVARNLSMTAAPAEGNVCAGGLVGRVDGGAVIGCTVNTVSVTANSNADGADAFSGGVAGYADSAFLRNFPADSLTGLIISAKAGKSDGISYAGSVIGASQGSAYEKVTVVSGEANAVTATNGESGETGKTTTAYAGGLTASSMNDTVRDVQLIKGDADFTIRADKGSVGGFAAKTDGSTFYRSFVRGLNVSTSTGTQFVSMVDEAVDTEMYGCYAQGVQNPTNAFRIITGGKYVGCYATQSVWTASGATDANTFNCYYQNTTGAVTPVSGDTGAKPVTADTLKGVAIGVMNAELMGTENGNTNGSGFDCLADFGAPIMYVADTATPVNGSFPVHGEAYLVTVKVADGAGYAVPVLKNTTGVYPVYITPTELRFYAAKGTDISLGYDVKATLAATNGAQYNADGASDAALAQAGTDVVTDLAANATVNVKFTPATYTYYTVDLKSGTNDASSVRGSGSVTLDGTEVNRYTSSGGKVNAGDLENANKDNDSNAIKTVILTVDNGAKLTMPAVEGWTDSANTTDKSYFHFNFVDHGVSAAAVQAFLRQVKVSTGSSNGDYHVSVFLYESKVEPIATNYGGHFYQYITGGYTWAEAYGASQGVYTQLGVADSYLATITSKGENDYLYNGLKAQNAWMGAVSGSQKSGITAVNDLMAGKTGWYWVTGPEAGKALNYTNWRAGEPNNYGGYEWAGAYAYQGRNDWNDFSGNNRYGYIVEYQAGELMNGEVYANDLYTLTRSSSGSSSGNGGGNGDQTTKPVDPDITGVSGKLNTDDHMLYLVGYDNGNFGPNDNMTRAQAAMMFYRLLRNQDVDISVTFSDVPENVWYAEAVHTLASMGIIQGIGDGRFAPDRSITRAEFVTISMRFADELTPGTKTFTDVPNTHWAYDYIMAATGYGWINGYTDGTFKPSGTITRAEVTTIVNHMLGRSADKAYVNAHAKELILFPDVAVSHWAYYDIVEATNAHDYKKAGGGETWTR